MSEVLLSGSHPLRHPDCQPVCRPPRSSSRASPAACNSRQVQPWEHSTALPIHSLSSETIRGGCRAGIGSVEQIKCLHCDEALVSCWEQTTSVTILWLEALITFMSQTGGSGPNCDNICVPGTQAKRPGPRGLNFTPSSLQ